MFLKLYSQVFSKRKKRKLTNAIFIIYAEPLCLLNYS